MDEWTKIALVGLAKLPQPPSLDPQDPIDALFAHADDPDPQHLFLLRAGSRAAYRQCGFVALSPAKDSAEDRVEDLSPAAPPDEAPVASNRIAFVLSSTIEAKATELLFEFLRVLAARSTTLPHQFLPTALDFTDEDVRAAILPLLGKRGQWLSQFQPQWQWVREGIAHRSDADIDRLKVRWEEDTFKERLKTLGMVRRCQPPLALQWLSESIGQEKPEHRAQLLQILSDGLSENDLEFLEKQLDDRSEAVRSVAAQLLARVATSSFAIRMWERGQSILNRDASTGVIHCTPPEELPKGWSRDGIPTKVATGRGKRAVWTETILGTLRPMLWCQHFERSPSELIAVMEQDDFETPVLIGWTRATTFFSAFDAHQRAWLDPLWEYWNAREQRARGVWSEHGYEPITDLFPHFDPERRESMLLPIMETDPSQTPPRFFQLLFLLERPWSERFAKIYLKQLNSIIERKPSLSHAWLQSFQLAIRSIPVNLISDALAPWESDSIAHLQWSQRTGFEKILDLLRARREFYRLIDHSNSR